MRRLTEAWTPSSGGCAAAPWVAGLGGPAPYWHSWTLNAVGNRVAETRHAAGGDTTSAYSYPSAGGDRPHAVSQVDTTGPVGDQIGVFGYDAAGNTTGRPDAGDDQTLSWDPEGHLASVTDGTGTVAEFVYGADGSRLLRRDLATGKTTLYWGGHTELTLTTATGAIKPARYYTFNGDVVAVLAGVIGPTNAGHALTLTLSPSVIKVGVLPPGAFCSTPITGTTTPSDSRCPPKDFTIGLYLGSSPDAGQADGSLLFRTRPYVRATALPRGDLTG